MVPLGFFLLGLIHSRRFRGLVLAGLSQVGALIRGVLVDAPAWLVRQPPVRAILQSRAFDLAQRTILAPALAAGLAFGLIKWVDGDRRAAFGISGAVFGVMAILLNTRLGRDAEELAADGLVQGWRRVRGDLLPGLARLILDVFDFILETVERVIYAVDEWLRYRSGQGRVTFWAKAVLGVFWFFATYLIRIYVNLLIEPQINPVKHFPTVTVAAKMILPIFLKIVAAIALTLQFLGPVPAYAIAWFTAFFLPGIAGFIVWELKENWRLYEANRPKTLRPIPIGHHGETMRRLLRPGLHSGTLPKLFAKLRKAEHRAWRRGCGGGALNAHDALHHVEGPIRHFVDRDLLALIAKTSQPPARACIRQVDLATNRIRVGLVSGVPAGDDLVFAFEERSGRLTIEILQAGWMDDLPEADRRRWHLAVSRTGRPGRRGVIPQRRVDRLRRRSGDGTAGRGPGACRLVGGLGHMLGS